jgi:PAS domain S-box-containing protein
MVSPGNETHQELLLKIHDLTLRLEEAQETLDAIHAATVDAVVVYHDGKHRVYTLEGVDTIYRRLFETLNEGVLVATADRTILYANRRFADLVGVELSRITGASVERFVPLAQVADFTAFLERAEEMPHRDDLSLIRADGGLVPVLVSINPAPLERSETGCAIVVTDLTELRQVQEALRRANEELEERIEARTADLLCANAALETEIAERMRVEEALRNEDRQKDEFLAILSHELRNPLTPLRNATQIMKKPGLDETRLAWCRDVIDRQVEHLVRLVDDLLDISRISRGKIELKKELVELRAIIDSAIESSQPFIESAGHELRVSFPDEPLLLNADPVRLTQVFANLLNNAAKYMKAGGKIYLSARRQEATAMVSVRDTGIGIPAEALISIFDLFTQVDRSTNHGQGGLGIGLALVRSLVQLHGGQVEVYSAGPDQGSDFVVYLPLATECLNDVTRPKTSASMLQSPRRILVVDDNHDVADSLGILLQFLGAEVQVVYDGASALETIEAFKPDLMILDLGMPGMDGYEVARQIRQKPGFQDVMLIALTGWGQKKDRARTRMEGFDYHLVKPVDIEALKTLLSL